jgi:hypothetical protein
MELIRRTINWHAAIRSGLGAIRWGRELIFVATLLALSQPTNAVADWMMKNPAEAVKQVESPFVREGEAVWFKAPSETHGGLIWRSHQVVPGERYSISFFFQNYRNENSAEQQRLSLNIYDGEAQAHTQILYRRNYPQFYTTELEFSSSQVTVRLDLPAGEEVVVGEFGRAVEARDLATTSHLPYRMRLWMPSLRIPDEYRGLRDFVAEVRLFNDRGSEHFGITAVDVVANMNMVAAKLPRLLPGANRLNLVSDAGAAGGTVELAIVPRDFFGKPSLRVEHDSRAPADGVTFSRVFITTSDDSQSKVPGAFYRLTGSSAVEARPYIKAVSDSQKLQMAREFHVTSLVPGIHSLTIENWNGRAWVDTGERIAIEFEAVAQPASDYRRSDYTRRWLEPVEITPHEEFSREWSWTLDAAGGLMLMSVPVDSALAPELAWRVNGPVTGLSMFADFQPDPRNLRTTAASLRDLVVSDERSWAMDYALGVEAYVALFMEGFLPARFSYLDYPSYGRLHREGRGWCMQYASAVHALTVEGGLESRFRNMPGHVVTEVRGPDLPVVVLDAMIRAAVVDSRGNRVALNQVGKADTQVLGFGADRRSPRGVMSDYYHNPILRLKPWISRDPLDSGYRNNFLDDEVFTLNLRAGETLSWRSGSVDLKTDLIPREFGVDHQTTLVQRSHFTTDKLLRDPTVAFSGVHETKAGLLAPADLDEGTFSVALNYPIEVSDLSIDLHGVIDPGGAVEVALYPDLETPLITGEDWVWSQ